MYPPSNAPLETNDPDQYIPPIPPLLTMPVSGVADSPLVSVPIQSDWANLLLSLVEQLEWTETWNEGTDVEDAKQQAYKLAEIIVNADMLIKGMPHEVTLWSDEFVYDVGVKLMATNPNQRFNHMTYATTLGASWTKNFWVAEDGYQIHTHGISHNTYGQLTYYIDGAFVQMIDMFQFSATHTFNNVWITGAMPLAAGWHTLRGTVTGRHASSTGYICPITKVWLVGQNPS